MQVSEFDKAVINRCADWLRSMGARDISAAEFQRLYGEGDEMPGKKYDSIQNPKQYEALRKEGHSKESAAKISNAQTPGHRVTRGGKK